jgi:regulator of protease activity HflC (stomatin/prohibitin superfamily)
MPLPDPTIHRGFRIRTILFAAVAVMLILLGLGAVLESYYIVAPNERAGVRQLGKVTTDKPIQPGVHFKMPFISNVDKALVSLTNLHIPKFTVTTVDNQLITLDINVSYTVPDSAVFHLLYEVGKSHGDIRDNVTPVVLDRVSRIFASQNTNSINENRETLQQAVTLSVAETLKSLFQVDVKSLQIASIAFSQAFNDSNANAVLAKNRAVQEENNLKVVKFQVDQKVLQAEGEAKQKVAESNGKAKSAEIEATGRAKATVLEATAEAQARDLRGKGEASQLEAVTRAVGGSANYIAILQARAQQNWKGAYPETMTVLGPNAPVLLSLPPSGPNVKPSNNPSSAAKAAAAIPQLPAVSPTPTD